MYTREDFLRDYPDAPTEPGLFAWLEELAQKKHQQGIEQGTEQGKQAMHHTIAEILQHRLGALPTEIAERLQACTLDQLNALVNPALDVTTWEEFAVYLPAEAR
ncbi:MAG: DUF4351 domain-containing protein [Caldilineaceae bacterium]